MPQEDEKLLKLREQRSKEAIDLAMQGRWREAIELNKTIIEDSPRDVDSYNRMGRAYMELGDYANARIAYGHAVELDRYNAIANRNLRRLADLQESDNGAVEEDKVEPYHFIEEIGKASIVSLFDLAPKGVRARMVAGDKVSLGVEGSGLEVANSRGEYLGRVESRHALRLAKLIRGGNRYSATVVRSTVDMMTIIIRETYQDPSQAGKLSFPPKGMEEFRAYANDKLLRADAEYDETDEDSGYTIIGGDEVEVLPEESEDTGNEEE
jgi:hypothetical protein